MGHSHGVDRIVYGGMTMVREPVREDDDTVIRARPGARPSPTDAGRDPSRTGSAGLRALGAAAAAADGALDDDPYGDPYGDTVVRPGRGARPGAGPSDEDTVLRARPGGPLPVVPPGAGAPRAEDGPLVRRTPSVRVGGRVVRLDRPLVVGRRPAAPRVVVDGGPVLVTVPSPSGQVSSSHVLLHAEGEAAVVADLRSTNGTVVRPPGAAPFRMTAGASIVVLTGTLVEIGDGNVIEVLSPHLRAGPDDGLPPFPPAP